MHSAGTFLGGAALHPFLMKLKSYSMKLDQESEIDKDLNYRVISRNLSCINILGRPTEKYNIFYLSYIFLTFTIYT